MRAHSSILLSKTAYLKIDMSFDVTDKNIERQLSENGMYASVTEGRSMRPLFKTHRDMVVIKRCDKPLSKYDVALYRVGEKYVLHRVIGIDFSRGIYLIRGDNTFKTEKIPFGDVIGVLESFNRKGKHYSVTDKGYMRYARLWSFIYPVRYVFYQPLRAARFLYRRLFKKRARES